MSACPACRAELPDGARFCPSCGTRVEDDRPEATERKVVTTLFADLVGFTALGERHDPEDVDAALRGYYVLARTIIERFGGVVEKFIGDAVVGLFGVPAAHEDDAERAVRAALEIVAHLHELPPLGGERLQVRCAVNTGPALVRLHARLETGEGVLVGDAVNTCARLLAETPAMAVIVGERTMSLSSRAIAYEELGALAAKGKSEPVRRWLARGRVARRGVLSHLRGATPMIGREVELATLDALLAKATASSIPQFALVTGEAGIGKSRLIGEFFRVVDERPNVFVQWRQAGCPPYGSDLAYSALRELVASHAGILRNDTPEAIDEKLRAVLADANDEWMHSRLHALIGLTAPPADREENFTAWLRFLESMTSKSPSVLVLEDLHWASGATLDFLEYVMLNIGPAQLCLIGTARPEYLDAHRDWRSLREESVHLHLKALDPEASRRLSQNLPPLAGRQDLTRAVAEACGGNPLFAEELAWLLSERAPTGEATRPESSSRPDVISTLIAARLDALPGDQREVLANASVVGHAFWPGAVIAAGEMDPPVVADALERLEAREFLRRSHDSTYSGEKEYTFWHALTRDVAYGQLTRGSRAERHERVALWLEERSDAASGVLTDALVHHYVTALRLQQELQDGEAERRLAGPAASHLVEAGRKGMTVDLDSAVCSLRQAREIAARDTLLRPQADLLLGESLSWLGKSEEAHEALQRALRGFQDLGATRDAAMAMSELSMVTWYIDGDRRSEELCDSALRMLAEDTPSPELVRVLETSAAVSARHFDSRSVIATADRAIGLAASLGMDPPSRALVYRAMARCDVAEADALAEFREILDKAVRSGSSGVGIMSANYTQDALAYQGPRKTMAAIEEWRAFAERRGDLYAELGHRCQVTWCLFHTGEWEPALALAERLDNELEQKSMWLDLEDHRSVWSQLLDHTGQTDRAIPLAEWAEKRGREGSGNIIDCLVALAGVRMSQGDTASALALLEEFAESSGVPKPVPWAIGTPAAIRIAAAAGALDLVKALRVGLDPVRAFDACASRNGEAFTWELEGDPEAAEPAFADAAALWGDIGEQYESACALFGRGRCLASIGRASEAKAVLSEARGQFASMGARPALQRVDESLAAIF